jgi:tetratricopeptide (TPR) repeat protein
MHDMSDACAADLVPSGPLAINLSMRIKPLQQSHLLAFFLLAVAIAIVYSNTLDAPWHLDDYRNIVINQNIKSQQPDLCGLAGTCLQFFKTALAERPLPMATFAINWHFGSDSTFGYHLVNIAIHVLVGWMLLLTCLILFKTPHLSGRYSPDQAFFISLLAVCLWALNPIQVQAVTYIIQRMASLAALFYLLGIYFFLKGRLINNSKRQYLYYLACLVSWLAACLSKENAALLPLSLLLVETVFFQDTARPGTKVRLLVIAAVMGFFVVAGGVLFFLDGNLSGILGYQQRFFSAGERLLTQGRILLFYLTLLVYPAPNRLSIAHDIELSTSLLHPWSTLPSLLIILVLIVGAFFRIRKWPLVSFAVLFFFLNHAIESTLIPLELIFEHRNYLPSLFFYLPLAAGIHWMMNHYQKRSRTITLALTAFVPLLLVGLGLNTYNRNMVWQSEKLLWEDALSKAPHASRPFHYLAWVHQQHFDDEATALVLYHKALKGRRNNRVQEAQIYNNMAAIFYNQAAYEVAAKYWLKSLAIEPDVPALRYRLALALARSGKLDAAAHQLQMVISDHLDYADAIRLLAIVHLLANDDAQALPLLRQALKLTPQDAANLVNLAAYYQRNAQPQKAIVFLHEALKINSEETVILIWLIAVNNDLMRTEAAMAYRKKLLRLLPVERLLATLDRLQWERICMDRMICPPIDNRLSLTLKAYTEEAFDTFFKPKSGDIQHLQSTTAF